MTDMVSRVVEVLDEGSVYLLPGRVMRSRVPKKQQPRRKIKPILPAKTTGERETYTKSKERDRKDRKDRKEVSGNTPLRWDGNKWVRRQQDSEYYKDKIRTQQIRKEEIDSKIQQLREISIRTVGMGIALGTIKSWANKVDSGIQKMKSFANQIKTAKDETERNKLDGEWKSVEADVDKGLRKMLMFSALLTTSGIVGLEKTLINKLKNTKRR